MEEKREKENYAYPFILVGKLIKCSPGYSYRGGRVLTPVAFFSCPEKKSLLDPMARMKKAHDQKGRGAILFQ